MTTNLDILALSDRLARAGYIADRPLATTLLLMESLERPLLLEGDAGVGKTALAQAYAAAHDTQVIRLQCYEGLDVGQAVYEWNYAHQLLAMKLQEHSDRPLAQTEAEIFSERFLLPRPLLKAITQDRPPVLLIDEIDRADEQFEAYLLELLSDWQVSIPELGTIRARSIPHVMLTSNGTRELSDALRRRCLYYFLDYPGVEKELRIVENRLPGINAQLARQVVKFVHGVRALDLRKRPGVAETLDWAAALMALEIPSLPENAERIIDTLGCLMKTQEDRQRLDGATLRGLLFKAAG
ncbi:MAG: MoxR family ATPase [Gammaproteobacteria bacterium]